MRILFLLHAHPELQAGGTEIFARDLFRALRRDPAVDGLFLAGTAAHQRPQSPGTPFQVVGEAADELLIWSGGFDPFYMSQVDLHGVAPPLAELLTELQPDVVHIHHLMTLGVEMVGVVRRVLPQARIVMTLHDYYAICANDGQMVTTAGALCHAASQDACRRCFPERGLTEFRLRALHIGGALDQVDRFVAPSRFLRDRYVAWGLDPARIEVVPNGLPAVAPAMPREAADGRRDRFGFFGHINRFKGATVALDASARLTREGVAHGLTLRGGTAHQSAETVARFEASRAGAADARFGGPYRRAEMGGVDGGARLGRVPVGVVGERAAGDQRGVPAWATGDLQRDRWGGGAGAGWGERAACATGGCGGAGGGDAAGDRGAGAVGAAAGGDRAAVVDRCIGGAAPGAV